MKVTPFFVSQHFPMITSWWKAMNFPVMESKYLPPTGFLVVDPEGAICAGFLYKADGGVCTIGHIVANPERVGDTRSEAIDLLITQLLGSAKEAGYDMVGASVGANLKRMNHRYRKLGFTQTDENINMLARRI